MATNLQGSSHRPRAVGFRLREPKGFYLYKYEKKEKEERFALLVSASADMKIYKRVSCVPWIQYIVIELNQAREHVVIAL